MSRRIIALTGYAQTGKDSVAAALEAEGYERKASGDLVRQVLYAMNPWVPDGDNAMVRLQELVDRIGWERAKVENAEVRRLMQDGGTEGARAVLGEDVWINATIATLQPTRLYVVTDARFPNEADLLRGHGAEVWRITRPGVGPLNDHGTETAMDGYLVDFTIDNCGTLDDLKQRVEWGLSRPYSTTATDAVRRADDAAYTGGPTRWDVV